METSGLILKMFLRAIFVCLSIASTTAFSPCFDKWSRITEVDMEYFSGRWTMYEVNYDSQICPMVLINASSPTATVFNMSVSEKIQGEWAKFSGTGKNEKGQFSVEMPNLPNDFVEFTLLAADREFKSWAVVMNCIEIRGQLLERATVIARSTANPADIERGTKAIKEQLGFVFERTANSEEDCKGSPL